MLRNGLDHRLIAHRSARTSYTCYFERAELPTLMQKVLCRDRVMHFANITPSVTATPYGDAKGHANNQQPCVLGTGG